MGKELRFTYSRVTVRAELCKRFGLCTSGHVGQYRFTIFLRMRPSKPIDDYSDYFWRVFCFRDRQAAMSTCRTPTGFYGSPVNRPTRMRRGRQLAPITASLCVEQDREARTYQPDEGLFDREEYEQDMFFSDPDESVSGRRNSQSCLPSTSASGSLTNSGIVAMLQAQQGTLQKVLTEQQNLTVIVKENEGKVKALEVSIQQITEKSDSSGNCISEVRIHSDNIVSFVTAWYLPYSVLLTQQSSKYK